jgi:type II secretory pathway component PulF
VKHDEFAFINRQLAGMLQSGVPLEGALRQICESMKHSPLREELQKLESDLASGLNLEQALAQRQLPPFYNAMLKVGVQSNQLPGVLILLADYYQKINSLWTRLRALMLYPTIVLVATLALSILIAVFSQNFMQVVSETLPGVTNSPSAPLSMQARIALFLWTPVGIFGCLVVAVAILLTRASFRRYWRWKFPAFHEAGLAQLASSLALMLEKGTSLPQALDLLQNLEGNSPAGRELALWQQRLAAGHKKFSEIAGGGKAVPPMFVWLVAGSGEDWAGGFKQAAEIYYARATHRIELLLYAALPVSVVALGIVMILEIVPLTQYLVSIMDMLGGTD